MIRSIVLICVQACLVENVLSQCLGRQSAPVGCGPAAAVSSGFVNPGLATAYGIGGYGVGFNNFGFPGPYAGGLPCGFSEYGGTGEGNVAVAGELPVSGTTVLIGQIPIMGAVTFGGPVAAAGSVVITGNCACGCGGLLGTPLLL